MYSCRRHVIHRSLRLGLLDNTLFASVLDYPYSDFVSSVFWSPLPLLPLVTYWASMAFILTWNMFHTLLDWRFSECVGEDPNLGCDILLLGKDFPLFLRNIVPLKRRELLDIVSHLMQHGSSCFVSLTLPVLCCIYCKIPVNNEWKPTRCTVVLKSLKLYCILILLYMFRAFLCPSSGAS
jgi:hypothetical protein